MLRLTPVEREQRRERHEHRQLDASEAVTIDVESGPVPRRHETRVTEHRPLALADMRGRLEIDQRDAVVRTDQDVEHVQVVDDNAALVNRLDRPIEAGADAQGPGGVVSDLGRVGHRRDQRIPASVEGVQRHTVNMVLNEEMMAPGLEVAVDARHDTQAGQLPQDVILTPEPGHGVRAIGGETGVGPGLFEHDRFPGSRVRACVDSAAIREMQSLVDLVGQILDRDRVPGREMRAEEGGQCDPCRNCEDWRAQVWHQLAGVVFDGRDDLAASISAIPLREAAVAHIERAIAVSQVAQDVGPVFAADEAVQLSEYALAGRVVHRVDGGELAAGAARGILGIPGVQGQRAAEKLEREPSRHAVVK